MDSGVYKMALPSLSSAQLCSATSSFKHPRGLFVVAVVLYFERVAREVTVQVNLEIVGLVLFLFCLSFTCSAIAVDTITYTLFLVSAEYSMVQ